MKKHVGKVLIYLLAMVSILSAAFIIGESKRVEAASTETYISSEYEYQINEDGSATITGYRGNGGDVVIPSVLDGVKVTSIGENAFKYRYGLKSITIPDSVISIGENAFWGCENLKSITIPDSVTSIGRYVFAACDGLTSITIPGSVTSMGGDAFWKCENLKSITIQDGVTRIGGGAFFGCSNLTDITIPDSVTSIGESAFWCCSSLKSIIIPGSVTSIGESAFYGCSSLASITIQNGVTSIGESAFWCCSSLKSITIPDSVTSIGYGVCMNCSSLTNIMVDEKNPVYSSSNNCLIEKNTNILIQGCSASTIPDGVISIGEYAFWYCSSLTSITIPNSVTSISHDAFYGCRSLTSITMPDSVTSIGYRAFTDCSSLKSITMPDSVTSIGTSAFYGCSSLASITIQDGVTSIGESAFASCSSLTSITIPDSVTSIGYRAFASCSNLTSIIVDEKNSVYSSRNNCLIKKNTNILIQGCAASIIPDGVTRIGESAFEGCSSLTSITIPNSVKSIGHSVFEGCSSLTSITIPNSETSIEVDAFKGCSSLTSIIIPNSVKSIEGYAFDRCSSLTSILIPDSVTSIAYRAFEACNKLTIYGSANSYAQKYANEHNIPFKIYNGHNFGVNTIVGTLEAVNLNDFTLKIDGADYDVSDDFDLNEATGLVVGNNGVKVIALLKNNQITDMDLIADVVVPKLSVTPEITNITYKNAKFSKDSFDVTVSISCDLEEPYYMEDVLEALGDTDISDIGVNIADITLSSTFSNSGEIPYLLKSGLFSSKVTTFTQSYNKFLKLGESEEFTVKAYLKEDYVPESINTVTEFRASVDNMRDVKAEVSISNEDRANEAAVIKKQKGTVKRSEINKLNNILNGTQAAFDDTLLREYLTDSEVKAVTTQVNNWIYTSNALNSIINDDSEGSLVKKLMKNAHFTKEDLMDTVFKKLGISQAKGMLTFRKPYTGTLRFEAKNKKDNKDIVIVFTMNMDFFAFGGNSSAYSGFGTISYQIEKAGFNAKSKKSEMNYESTGSGTGIITYADYDSFAESLKKVLEGQIHNCYSKLYGEGIDSIADQMLSGTFSQVVNAKYGSASEMVYTSLKYGFTGYDEDDAKKSIKDITIILTKEFVKKTTRLEGHCPVDIIVYDSEGNVCAKITDNTVDTQYDEIIAYVDGDDKYLILPDDDFVVSYAGNDTGTMDCIIKEYENDELVRTIEYTKVPLSKEISYSNYFSEGRRQGKSLYDLYNTDDEAMESSTDTEVVENISADSLTLDVKELKLNIGDTYLLKEQFEPFNANNTQIQWSSSNENVATVDEHGEITAVRDGSAVISAENSFSGLTAVCNVTVLKDENAQPTDKPENTSKPSAEPSGTEKPTTKPEGSTKPTESGKPTDKPENTSKPSAEPSGTEKPTIKPEGSTKPTGSETTPSETTKPNATLTPETNVTTKPKNTPENGGGSLKTVKLAKVSIKSVKSGKKKVTAVWKKVSGAKGYRIQIATNRKFTKGLKQYKVSAKTLTKVIKKLKSKKIYYIRIAAWNSNDKGKVINGKYSAIKKIKIK